MEQSRQKLDLVPSLDTVRSIPQSGRLVTLTSMHHMIITW